jgi:hypothetical protein
LDANLRNRSKQYDSNLGGTIRIVCLSGDGIPTLFLLVYLACLIPVLSFLHIPELLR